mmetsp:Transcript_19650/g.45953  ORF Transcript_19650/g.45953 Transcript_19650/m.45953 type:complete len:246 (-) Transcript_19650:408-1145(-)
MGQKTSKASAEPAVNTMPVEINTLANDSAQSSRRPIVVQSEARVDPSRLETIPACDLELAALFLPGQKLEALDKAYPGWGCGPATVLRSDPATGRVLIHFDGWGAKYDEWTCPSDTDIGPVGTTQGLGLTMNPPKGVRTGKFEWLQYLEETEAEAVPLAAFGERPLADCLKDRRISKRSEGADPSVFEAVYGMPFEEALESMIGCAQLTKAAFFTGGAPPPPPAAAAAEDEVETATQSLEKNLRL